MKTAALDLAARGLPVFPLEARGKRPLTPTGCKAATLDPAMIAEWWDRWPTANIGIATGSGLFVFDVDGPEGEAALVELEAKNGKLPETLQVRTGRGRHVYFRGGPRLKNSAGKLGPKLDTRGEGGYVVAPPSVHESGAVYTFTNPGTPMADVPAWLVERLTEKPKAEPRPPAPPVGRGYGAAALADAARTIAAAGEGSRNHTVNAQAFGIGSLVGGGVISLSEAEGVLIDAALSCGLPEWEARAAVA